MNLDPLLNLIQTEEDRREILDFLDDIYRGLFRTGGVTGIISGNKKFGPTLLQVLPEGFENMDYAKAGKNILEIIEKIKSLPTAEIILATTPTQATLAEIAKFLTDKTPEKTIVNIKIDPTILGGGIFILNGKYMDLSITNKLAESFEDKGDINAILDIK